MGCEGAGIGGGCIGGRDGRMVSGAGIVKSIPV